MRLRFRVATCALLASSCVCLAAAQQPSQPQTEKSPTAVQPPLQVELVWSRPSPAQQERPGVPQGAAEPSFGLTRHGTILFEADVRAPGSSRVILTETIEIASVKNKEGWGEFISAFAASTSRAWLDAIPSSADTKRGKAIIGFALRRGGTLDGALSISHSSGDPSLDSATRLAIAKSAPFPALPASFLRSVAEFRVTFAYNHPHALPPATGNGGPQ